MRKGLWPFMLSVLLAVAEESVLRASETGSPDREEAAVVLRVLRDGAAADGLREQDIRLLADNRPQAVSGWRNVKKALGTPAVESRRLVVLLFHLNEYPASMHPALASLFRDLLRDDDRLLVLANQATLLIDGLADRGKSAAAVEAFVQGQALRFQRLLAAERKNLEERIGQITSDYDRVTANIHRHYYMKGFLLSLNEYLNQLREYKRRYLLPTPELFTGLCPQLAESSGENWIIAFWQLSAIPKMPRRSRELVARVIADFQESAMLDENDYGSRIKRWLTEAGDVFTGASSFPGPAVYNLLAGNAATVHAFYLPPSDPALAKDAEFSDAAGQARDILAGLAANSGGLFRPLTEPAGDMTAIGGKADSYYVLKFRPAAAYKKIGIQFAGQGMAAWFDPLPPAERERECRAGSGPRERRIELEDVVLKGRRLAFRIVHFLQGTAGEKPGNRIFVRVCLRDEQERKVFEQSRQLVPRKEEIAVSIDLPESPAGRHSVEIEVDDSLTGRTHTRILSARLE